MISTALDLVFKFSGRAGDHEALCRRNIALIAEVCEEPYPAGPMLGLARFGGKSSMIMSGVRVLRHQEDRNFYGALL